MEEVANAHEDHFEDNKLHIEQSLHVHLTPAQEVHTSIDEEHFKEDQPVRTERIFTASDVQDIEAQEQEQQQLLARNTCATT